MLPLFQVYSFGLIPEELLHFWSIFLKRHYGGSLLLISVVSVYHFLMVGLGFPAFAQHSA